MIISVADIDIQTTWKLEWTVVLQTELENRKNVLSLQAAPVAGMWRESFQPQFL